MPVPISSIVAAAGSSRPKPPVEGTGDFDSPAWVVANAVAGWGMNDSEPVDFTGRGNNLSDPSELVTDAPGKIGNACLFSAGDSTYLSRASTADLQIGAGDWLVATWVNPASGPGGMTILSKPTEYWLYVNFEPKLQFTWGDGAGAVFADALGAPGTGTWYLVIVWFDSANQQLHLRANNGTSDVSGLGDAAVPAANDLYVGSFDGTQGYFDGLIDDTIIFKPATPLSSDDFDALCTYLWDSGNGKDLSVLFS
jgi:hypothetical protein